MYLEGLFDELCCGCCECLEKIGVSVYYGVFWCLL